MVAEFVNTGKTFYDIHLHLFNLSDPNLLAFLNRLKIPQLSLLNALLGPLSSYVIGRNMGKIRNLLAVMENDVGSILLTLEDSLFNGEDSSMNEDKLVIGGNEYSRFVLTPLMIDFGYKGVERHGLYYPRKPVIEQVIDVFNGIKKYRQLSRHKVFEIYPFLGLNPRNYDLRRMVNMMDKYFGDYRHSRQALQENMGSFDGNIEHLGGNHFAGIKVYPPLGFDPWPEDIRERVKVEYLYDFCACKNIPVIAHGSASEFTVISHREARRYTAVSKWRYVLERYPTLQLDLAHFPAGERALRLFPRIKRLNELLALIAEFENIYVDFSCRAIDEKYFDSIERLSKRLSPGFRKKLENRILFGSDFPVSLMSVCSYNSYLAVFAKTASISDAEKDLYCSANPERFLFGDSSFL